MKYWDVLKILIELVAPVMPRIRNDSYSSYHLFSSIAGGISRCEYLMMKSMRRMKCSTLRWTNHGLSEGDQVRI